MSGFNDHNLKKISCIGKRGFAAIKSVVKGNFLTASFLHVVLLALIIRW